MRTVGMPAPRRRRTPPQPAETGCGGRRLPQVAVVAAVLAVLTAWAVPTGAVIAAVIAVAVVEIWAAAAASALWGVGGC